MPDNRRSKRLSYWLRHAPKAGRRELDEGGWASTAAVLDALHASGLPTSKTELEAIVADSEKQRFELTEDGKRLRARQGHSIKVNGDWPVASPPELLYHGTTNRFLPSILERGLLPGSRHHVHLSSSIEIAQAVGARRGPPVVLLIAAVRMADDGFAFRLSSNGVWLAEHVPPAYLQRLEQN